MYLIIIKCFVLNICWNYLYRIMHRSQSIFSIECGVRRRWIACEIVRPLIESRLGKVNFCRPVEHNERSLPPEVINPAACTYPRIHIWHAIAVTLTYFPASRVSRLLNAPLCNNKRWFDVSPWEAGAYVLLSRSRSLIGECDLRGRLNGTNHT